MASFIPDTLPTCRAFRTMLNFLLTTKWPSGSLASRATKLHFTWQKFKLSLRKPFYVRNTRFPTNGNMIVG
eukprot:1390368-Amphidinium_carterae.1